MKNTKEEEEDEIITPYNPDQNVKKMNISKRTIITWYKENHTKVLEYLSKKHGSKQVEILPKIMSKYSMNTKEGINCFFHNLCMIGTIEKISFDAQLIHDMMIVKEAEQCDLESLIELDLNWNVVWIFDTPDHPFEIYLKENYP